MQITIEDLESFRWIPPALAAAVLGVSRQRIHQLANNGQLAAVRVHGKLYVSRASVLERYDRLKSEED